MKYLFNLKFFDKKIDVLIDELNLEIKKNNKVSVFTPNVDHIINSSVDELIEKKYSESEYIIADGWPLVLIGRMRKNQFYKITGVDLMDKLLELSNEKKYNVFFLGGQEECLEKLTTNIKREYPLIGKIGCHHGYFKDDSPIIDLINENETNILFVGMGNPKQELWIRDNMSKLSSNINIGVGGAFNILSGDISRAPKWIQNIGMEWFYRFLKEPKRLFYRYFIKYPKFITIALREWSK